MLARLLGIRPRGAKLSEYDAAAAPATAAEDFLASAFPLSEANLTRRVTKATLVAWGFAACSLGALWATAETPSAQGVVAACGAILTFGASSLPAKHPAAAAAGPLAFQLWVTCGNTLLNAVLLFALRVPLHWNQWGVLGAATLTATQLFAWPAIQALGAAAGPGIWCGVGMATSFIWGVVVFGEVLQSPALGVIGIGTLVVGVIGVASAQSLAMRKAAMVASSHEVHEVPLAATELSAHPTMAVVAVPHPLVRGVVCALATGLFDGTLMAPFSAFQASTDLADEAALRYLGAFTLGLPSVGLAPVALALALRRALGRPQGGRRPLLTAAALPGVCCGGLWAVGNVLSVHATMRLGQAVGFPLTQVCVLVSALWGILYFGELRDRQALALFGASSAVVLAGAGALKAGAGLG